MHKVGGRGEKGCYGSEEMNSTERPSAGESSTHTYIALANYLNLLHHLHILYTTYPNTK